MPEPVAFSKYSTRNFGTCQSGGPRQAPCTPLASFTTSSRTGFSSSSLRDENSTEPPNASSCFCVELIAKQEEGTLEQGRACGSWAALLTSHLDELLLWDLGHHLRFSGSQNTKPCLFLLPVNNCAKRWPLPFRPPPAGPAAPFSDRTLSPAHPSLHLAAQHPP